MSPSNPSCAIPALDSMSAPSINVILRLHRAHACFACDTQVMELVAQDLHQVLEERPSRVVSEDVALLIWQQIMAGLQHVHTCSMMHRDVHTGNVLVHHSAPSQSMLGPVDVVSVKLADFGKATCLREHMGFPMWDPPQYTSKTANSHATAPEIIFRNGTRWKRTGKRPANSQIDGHATMSAPPRCSYDEKVDVWASGILFIRMAKGNPYESRAQDEVAMEMVQIFGKVPIPVARRLQWSVPVLWETPAISQPSAPSQWGQHEKLRFESSRGPRQVLVQTALAALCYDPARRPKGPAAASAAAAASAS